MVSLETENPIKKFTALTFGLAACADIVVASATIVAEPGLDGRLLGLAMALPAVSLMGAGFNLEHPFKRVNPRISDMYSIVEGGLGLVAAGMMAQWLLFGGDPDTFLRGVELAKATLLVTGLQSLASMSRFNHLPASLMTSD